MIALNLKHQWSACKRLADSIFAGLKIGLIIRPLQLVFYKRKRAFTKQLAACEIGTIGHEIHLTLQRKGLKVIPLFEDHDLKHVLLGYDMTAIDEVRMQFYLMGNGNKSVYCLLVVASGIIYPNYWKIFREDLEKGKLGPDILKLKLADVMHQNALKLRRDYVIS